MSLERFTRKKVATVGPEAPISEVATLMRRRHVGAVVVVEKSRPIGILTDRDLALRAVARGLPRTTIARLLMSRELVVARAGDSLDHALFTMRRTGVRRLPIVDKRGALVGLVALDDILVLLAGELSCGAEAVLDNRGP